MKRIIVPLLLLAALLGLAGTSGASVARTGPVINHQFCLSTGRHLCMATRHAGINSGIVLRVNGHTRAQAITFRNGRLVINGHPGQCVGGDRHLVEARSAHCDGGHGIRWRRIVFPGRGIGFDNVAADRADPGPRQHFLLVPAQIPGIGLAIGSNLSLPHVWRDCAGHCAAPAAATAAVHPLIIDCPTDGVQNNPRTNIWVHVDPATGIPTIRGHAQIWCTFRPNEIHGKIHFQRYVFPPRNEPIVAGHWKEIVASKVYSGLNAHMILRVPDHHIRWRPGRWRLAFEIWGRSSGNPPGGDRYGSGYWCTSNLDVPHGPPSAITSITISPDTHRCFPPPV